MRQVQKDRKEYNTKDKGDCTEDDSTFNGKTNCIARGCIENGVKTSLQRLHLIGVSPKRKIIT